MGRRGGGPPKSGPSGTGYVNHSYTKCDMVYRVFLSPRAAFVLVLSFAWPVLMNLVLALRHSLSENKKALVA